MSAPAPHSLTVGELAGMFAGLDAAAFSNVVALRRQAGELVQYKLEVFDPVQEGEDRLYELRKDLRSEKHKCEALRLESRALEKRLGKLRRALASIAKLTASKRLPLP